MPPHGRCSEADRCFHEAVITASLDRVVVAVANVEDLDGAAGDDEVVASMDRGVGAVLDLRHLARPIGPFAHGLSQAVGVGDVPAVEDIAALM